MLNTHNLRLAEPAALPETVCACTVYITINDVAVPAHVDMI